MKERIYIEHQAGEFVDGLQVCILCGKVITDYTGDWVSDKPLSPLLGFPVGKVWIHGSTTTTDRPLDNYGGGDPYKRVIKLCTDQDIDPKTQEHE